MSFDGYERERVTGHMTNLKRGERRVWAPPRGLEMVVISDFDEPDELPELSDDRRERVVKIMRQLALASSETKGEHLTDAQKDARIRDRARVIRELVSKSHEATL